MSDRAKKVSELSEVTSITASDTLLYVVTGANSTPTSRKMKVSSLLSNVSIGTAAITTLNANTINVVSVGNNSTTMVANTVSAITLTANTISGISVGNTSTTIVANTISASVVNASGQIKVTTGDVGSIVAANSYPWIVAYGSASHGGTEITWTDADDLTQLYSPGIKTNTAYVSPNGFWIDLNYNDVDGLYQSFGFKDTGELFFPDGSAQNTAWTGTLSGLSEIYIKQKFVYEADQDVISTDVIDCSQSTTKFYFQPYNIFSVEIQNANLNPGECLTVKLVIQQQAQASQFGQSFIPQNLYIFDGVNPSVLLDVKWVGGSLPTPSLGKIDVIEYTVFNNNGTYIALGERKVHG